MSVRKGSSIIASAGLINISAVDDVLVDGTSVVTDKVAEIDLSGKQNTISDLATIRSGAALGATAVQPSSLATVATSGSYNDLSNKPTIPAAQVPADWNATTGVARILNKPTIPTVPTNVSEFTNDAGYQTSTQVSNAISTHNSSTSAHSDIRSAIAGKSTVSVSDTGTSEDEVQYITIDGVEKKLAGGSAGSGSGRNIGDIFYTARTDTALAGAVECNGGTYSTADYTGTGSIGELLRTGKLPYVSLAQYATLLSTNGVVGVFGWDGTGTTTFRVPTLQDVFIECGQASELGDYVSASIPNLKCSIGNTDTYRNPGNLTVIDGGDGFAQSLGSVAGEDSDGARSSRQYGFSLNASRVSSVYKDDATTVQPEAVKYRAMVQLFNATTDEAVATVGTVVAQVGTLVSQVGTLNTRTNGLIDYIIEKQDPTAENGYVWYKKYKSGRVEQGGSGSTTAGNAFSVTYPIPMLDTNYTLLVSSSSASSTTSSTAHGCHYTSKNTTGCSIMIIAGNSGNWIAGTVNWLVIGMKAQE